MKKANLSEKAYNDLLHRIITCKYAPGALLNEELLVEELGCSRTPIRSALVRLQAEHLVQTLPKRGILVCPVTLNDIRDVYNLRELFETYALSNYGSNFDKGRLIELRHLFESPVPADKYFYNDTLFHKEIISQTRNTFIIQQFTSLQNIMQRMSRISGEATEDRVALSNQEHIRIITLLLKDDCDGAVNAMLEHLNNGRASTYQAVLADQTVMSQQ